MKISWLHSNQFFFRAATGDYFLFLQRAAFSKQKYLTLNVTIVTDEKYTKNLIFKNSNVIRIEKNNLL